MMETGVRGEYQISVLDSEGNQKQETEWFDNALLDAFFTGLAAGTAATSLTVGGGNARVHVGTGTTPVTFAQTQMANQTATLPYSASTPTAQNFTTNGTTWSFFIEYTFTFTPGAVTGNISEVGLAFGMRNGLLPAINVIHSRALVTDGQGNPTTITVTASDQLIVKYRLNYSGLEEATTNVTISGTTYTVLGRRGANAGPFQLTTFDGRTIEAFPSAATFGVAGVAVSGSNLGQVWMQQATTGVAGQSSGLAPAAVGDWVGNIAFLNTGWMKFQITPTINKTNQQTLSLVFGRTFTRG